MSGINAYREHNVATQSREHLIVMLYDGAIRFLRQAIEAAEAQDFAKKGELIGKAIDVINELNLALDFDASEEICNNLRGLYTFMIRHLNEANIHCDAKRIREIVGLLEELNQAWRAISA
jgi:flagellar protein FliS